MITNNCHLKTVREYVMNTVVIPANPDATPMAVPAKHTAKRQNRTEKPDTAPTADEVTQTTPIDWKAVQKADRARQRKWQQEYREAAAKLRQEAV